jgi:hypothetical protein
MWTKARICSLFSADYGFLFLGIRTLSFESQNGVIQSEGTPQDNLMMDYLLPSIGEKLAKKRLIFTISPGRCGTTLLAKILDSLPHVDGVHEPFPKFSDVMRYCQTEPKLALGFWTCSKLPAITYSNSRIYAETSHLFAKGFIEPLCHLGIIPDIIFLSRPARDVALSLYQLNTIPSRTPNGLKFLLSPEDPGVARLCDWEKLHDYQLCYWYCMEIERRSRLYENFVISNNWNFSKITLDDLKTIDGTSSLLSSLRLVDSELSKDTIDVLTSPENPFNTHHWVKEHHSKCIELDFDKLESEVQDRFHPDDIVEPRKRTSKTFLNLKNFFRKLQPIQ